MEGEKWVKICQSTTDEEKPKELSRMSRICFVLSFFVLFSSVARGEAIDWKTYEDGIRQIRETEKPGFLLIYNPACPACQTLDRTFKNSKLIQELSKEFVMIRASYHSIAPYAEFQIGR